MCNGKNLNVPFCSDLLQSTSSGYFTQKYDNKKVAFSLNSQQFMLFRFVWNLLNFLAFFKIHF